MLCYWSRLRLNKRHSTPPKNPCACSLKVNNINKNIVTGGQQAVFTIYALSLICREIRNQEVVLLRF